MKIICNDCGIPKDESEFGWASKKNNQLKRDCKLCRNLTQIKYKRSKKGLATKIYGSMRTNSKKRGHKNPLFTKKEFSHWLFSQYEFEQLYLNWVKSNYYFNLVPSVDRLKNDIGYSFNNIRLVTRIVNVTQGSDDMRNGLINHGHKAVELTEITTGIKKIFISIRDAARKTGIPRSSIKDCITGRHGMTKTHNYTVKLI